jgi:hypothetical protein
LVRTALESTFDVLDIDGVALAVEGDADGVEADLPVVGLVPAL